MVSKISTRRGDAGTTSSLGGDAFSKAHPMIDCLGALDRLRAQTALLRLLMIERKPGDLENAEFLFWLLHCCFMMGAQVSDVENHHPEWRHGDLEYRHLSRLEARQEKLESMIELPKGFIASAANVLAAEADLTAVAARDFERSLVRVTDHFPPLAQTVLLPFSNRLGDFFYVLARYLDGGAPVTVNYALID